MFLRLPPPQEVAIQNESEVRTIRQIVKARKVRMGKRKRSKMDRDIKKWFQEWEDGTSGQRAKSAELNEFLEGQDEAVDFPFGVEASSSIDVRLAAGYARTARAQFNRSLLSDPSRTYIMLKTPGLDRASLNKVERGVNYTAEYESNLNETLKDSFLPCYRDGTYLIHGSWERRIEHGFDFKRYSTSEDFKADYPNAGMADISQEDYDLTNEYLDQDGAELHVEYELDFVTRNAAKYTGFPLAKFLHWPLAEQDIERKKIYGYTFTECASDFDSKAKMGFYDSDVVEECKKVTSSQRGVASSWDQRREALEGIGQSNSVAISYNLAWIVFSDDTTGNGVTERYVVLYDLDKFKSLRIESYTLRRNIPCIVPVRLVRRDGRFAGVSLLHDGEHLFREINALHRHRSNQRRITDSVTLMLPEGVRESVDLGAEYATFAPGTPLWLPDQYMHPNMAPRQLAIQDTSRTQGSIDEEGLVQRYLDMLLGTSQGQSGRESTQDPSAPASKTAMLLQRADLRMEDFADEFARTIPDIIDLHRALIYQNAESQIKVMAKSGENMVEESIDTRLFANPQIRGALKPIKPSLAPEVEMQKIAAIAMAAMQFQLPMMQKPEIIVHLWNDYVAAARVERPERYQIEIDSGGQASMGGQQIGQDQIMSTVEQLLAQGQEEGGQGPFGGGPQGGKKEPKGKEPKGGEKKRPYGDQKQPERKTS